MLEFDAYILIGGRSSRLGADKAFVEIGGRSLTTRAIDAIRGALPMVNVTAVAGYETQFAIQAITAGIPFIFDLYEGRGPISGFHTALVSSKTPWIFLVACDFPFVSAELIALLAGMVDPDHGAIVPEQSNGRIQPLCAFYKVDTALPPVQEILDRPRVPPPMHEIVRGLIPRIVRFEEYSHLPDARRLFININTPDDLESARME